MYKSLVIIILFIQKLSTKAYTFQLEGSLEIITN